MAELCNTVGLTVEARSNCRCCLFALEPNSDTLLVNGLPSSFLFSFTFLKSLVRYGISGLVSPQNQDQNRNAWMTVLLRLPPRCRDPFPNSLFNSSTFNVRDQPSSVENNNHVYMSNFLAPSTTHTSGLGTPENPRTFNFLACSGNRKIGI